MEQIGEKNSQNKTGIHEIRKARILLSQISFLTATYIKSI